MAQRSPDAPQPSALPTAEVIIEVNRETGTLVVLDAEIHAGEPGVVVPPHFAQQVRWIVRSGLLPDELVLVFEKNRDWYGVESGGPDSFRVLENVFDAPFQLGRSNPEHLSGPPRVTFEPGESTVGWPYGIVLVRGRDVPLAAHPMIKIHRAT